jgi:hypothetical protein
MKRLIIAAFLFTAACQAAPQEVIVDHPDMPTPAVQVPENATPQECAARGGTMKRIGRAQTLQCVVAYTDAGKRCTTGSECQGDCRVEQSPFPEDGASAVGQCQADSQPFGCHATVENGKATQAICID